MGQISWSVCSWQALAALEQCNTLPYNAHLCDSMEHKVFEKFYNDKGANVIQLFVRN